MNFDRDVRYREIKQWSDDYEKVTGVQGFLYPYQTGNGEPTRFVFQRVVCLGIASAHAYARGLLRMAQDHQEKEAAARRAAEIAQEMKELT